MANWPKSRMKANGMVRVLSHGVLVATYRTRSRAHRKVAQKLMREVLAELQGARIELAAKETL